MNSRLRGNNHTKSAFADYTVRRRPMTRRTRPSSIDAGATTTPFDNFFPRAEMPIPSESR